ncbi:Asp-tRNA(Asn)/Glu-tRNA(Gln) amidotransferase subunit GatC [Botrimarina sp.]|uniref:Asp-tRNA(Asn)/Glu-tRNA(Gln) amidotransferase subunit GatC n=1 Tax=Botrimarina sp. TaxID=2795802 RepID=UPI0032ED22D4
MAISREDVERVALLARLELDEAQVAELTPQLAEIVAYVDQLAEVDTEGVEPMAHAVELTNVLRPDAVRPGLSHEAALANAPRHDHTGFRVPAVLDE